ncbi:long-chain fatty acid--CoA ligase [Alloscardovia macacae]|uniref:Acyl-CoA synthetase n=1 Tax=Alloscardovia macacae TaxID=1160091 RepID=A0A1Y2SZT0_9BIFI|nr:AMP-dependent synthetase/ligase [Alloscardovia macacae]OTA27609.1 long-chain fatty acid--CoA ligase [Alloscardovia macacae]OTA30255.1 long-chain fatty acid--CoA ligase [Alloscardovia macacae]
MLREYSTDIIYTTTDEDTVFKLLSDRVAREPQSVIAQALRGPRRQWVDITAQEMMASVRKVAKGLLAMGIQKEDTVLIYAPTSYEWGVVDFACAAIGAISVPVYDTDSPKQVAQIVASTSPVVAFAGGDERALVLEELRQADDTSVQYSFNIQSNGLKAAADWGKDVSDEKLNDAISRVKADDPLTIIFTSGSTGKPKGAILSHRNFTHTAKNGWEVLPTMLGGDPTRLLMFLPLAHAFARYIQYAAAGAHGVIGYLSDTKHLLADVRGFKPSYMLAVPRVYEKVYNAASQKAGNGVKGHIFNAAFKHFVQWSKDEQDGKGHSFAEKLRHSLYMSAVGSSINSAMGNGMQFMACGGAPMNDDLAHFFNGIDGITFIQGYGLTETAAPCVVNFEKMNRVGSVGRIAPGFSVRLTDEDELEIKGPSVFQGYLNNPEQTAEVMDDGWFKTGDLASIDDDGFIYITGRKKDLIITAGGKNVSPAPLEDIISTCPIVSAAVVVGDNKPFIAALITLEPEMLRQWLEGHGLDTSMTPLEAAKNEAVRAYIQEFIDRANATVSRAESVRKFVVLASEFSQDAGTLTPSLKIVRPRVIAQYKQVIDEILYAPKPSAMSDAATARIMMAAEELNKQVQPTVKAARERLEPMYTKAMESVKAATKPDAKDLKDSANEVKEK